MTGRKILLAAGHAEPLLHTESLAVGVAFEHQQRRIGRDDVELFGQPDDLVLDDLGAALAEQVIQFLSGPKPGDKRVARLVVFQGDLFGLADFLAAEHAGHDDVDRLILALAGQVASQEDLLHAGGQIRQPLGIDPAAGQPDDLDVQVPHGRGRDLAEQFQRDCLRAELAGDLAHRTAAQRRDGPEHLRLVAAAHRDGMECAALALMGQLEPVDESLGATVATGHDPVADVDYLGVGTNPLHHVLKEQIQIAPAQRHAIGEERSRGLDIRLVRRDSLLKDPIALHIAADQIELVLLGKRAEQRGDELGLGRAACLIDRRRRIGQDQQFDRLAVGDHTPPARTVGHRRRELQHEIAVRATAMRDHDDVRPARLDFYVKLEIASRRILQGRELDVGRMCR